MMRRNWRETHHRLREEEPAPMPRPSIIRLAAGASALAAAAAAAVAVLAGVSATPEPRSKVTDVTVPPGFTLPAPDTEPVAATASTTTTVVLDVRAVALCDHLASTGQGPTPELLVDVLEAEGGPNAAAARIGRWVVEACPDQLTGNPPLRLYLHRWGVLAAFEEALRG